MGFMTSIVHRIKTRVHHFFLPHQAIKAIVTHYYCGDCYCCVIHTLLPFFSLSSSSIAVETFNSRYCALVPIIYKPDAKRPFGHSRISRACMDYVKSAMRTLKRAEISSEFYSFPQKYAIWKPASRSNKRYRELYLYCRSIR